MTFGRQCVKKTGLGKVQREMMKKGRTGEVVRMYPTIANIHQRSIYIPYELSRGTKTPLLLTRKEIGNMPFDRGHLRIPPAGIDSLNFLRSRWNHARPDIEYLNKLSPNVLFHRHHKLLFNNPFLFDFFGSCRV